MEAQVAHAITVFMGDDPYNPQVRRSAAKTVLSAYVIGHRAEIAAQRLLSWDCIEKGKPEEDLSRVSLVRGEPFIRMAFAGYLLLEQLTNPSVGAVQK